MKERPILFSGAMVRAILEGRKTQTRRAAGFANYKPTAALDGLPEVREAPATHHHAGKLGAMIEIQTEVDNTTYWFYPCPHGEVGDRLWVRESFFDNNALVAKGDTKERDLQHIYYRADGEPDFEGESITRDGGGWRSPIHMPRWASRITLEITGIRVERVQEISEADAIAEGIKSRNVVMGDHRCGTHKVFGLGGDNDYAPTAKSAYQDIWDSINAKKPGHEWADNCWVWVIEFNRIESEAA